MTTLPPWPFTQIIGGNIPVVSGTNAFNVLTTRYRFGQRVFFGVLARPHPTISLRLTEPLHILIEAMPQRWNSLGIA
jgi:hypothetical protein